MCRNGRCLMMAALVTMPTLMPGCTSLVDLLPDNIDVPFDLETSGIGTFTVSEGEPQTRLATFDINTAGITPASGTIDFSADTIMVTVDDATTEKGSVSAQESNDCLDACAAGGASDEVCQNVCENNVVDVRVWFRDAESVNEDCNVGDEYRITIELDGGDVTGVTVDPTELADSTLAVMSSGEFSACFQVIAPFSGEIILSEMVITVSP